MAMDNGVLKVLPKVAFGPEEVGIHKVEQGEVLWQIILDWCSGKDDSTLNVEAIGSLERQGFCRPSRMLVQRCEEFGRPHTGILEPVPFITKEQPDLAVVEMGSQVTEHLVRHDHHYVPESTTSIDE